MQRKKFHRRCGIILNQVVSLKVLVQRIMALVMVLIYKNRASKDYFKQVATIDDGYQELNEEWKRQWGNNYIDLLSPSMVDGRHVRVFTNDNKFISQDCRHLTRAGAKWYSSLLNWNVIFSK